MKAIIELTAPQLKHKKDGTGWDMTIYHPSWNRILVTIGHVTLSLNDPEHIEQKDCAVCCLQFGPNRDDPVRYQQKSIVQGDSPGEKLMYALAEQYGFHLVSKAQTENVPSPGDQVVYHHSSGKVQTSNLVERKICRVTHNPVYHLIDGEWVGVESVIGIFKREDKP